MKRVVDLKNDEELNAASWQAAKGAVIGAARVSSSFPFRSQYLFFKMNSGRFSGILLSQNVDAADCTFTS
jgi:hypothetical protein